MAQGWDYYTQRRDWAARRLRHRVNLSLCHVEQVGGDVPHTTGRAPLPPAGPLPGAPGASMYRLNIRTLFEKDIHSMFLRNRALVALVLDHAGQTSLENPFVELPPLDRWFALTAIQNEISSMFSVYHVMAEVSPQAVDRSDYWFGLTREVYPGMQARFDKLRVMLVHEATLEHWPHVTRSRRLSAGRWSDRWTTLDKMHELYLVERQHAAADQPHHLMRVSIATPKQ